MASVINLSGRKRENLGYQRTYIDEPGIRQWFQRVSDFLKNEHVIDVDKFFVQENADRVFNCDESGFPGNIRKAGTPGKLKIIRNRGAKNVCKVAPDTREQVTALGCCSVRGNLMKPLVVYPGVRPTFNFKGVGPDDFSAASFQNGWMTANIFFGWLANVLYPAIRDQVSFPIVIFLDGHASDIRRSSVLRRFCFWDL